MTTIATGKREVTAVLSRLVLSATGERRVVFNADLPG
jgi:hypothetical protein